MRVSTAACPACHRENQIEHDDSIKGERGVIVTCDHCGVTKRLTAFRKEYARQLASVDRQRRKAQEAVRKARRRDERERQAAAKLRAMQAKASETSPEGQVVHVTATPLVAKPPAVFPLSVPRRAGRFVRAHPRFLGGSLIASLLVTPWLLSSPRGRFPSYDKVTKILNEEGYFCSGNMFQQGIIRGRTVVTTRFLLDAFLEIGAIDVHTDLHDHARVIAVTTRYQTSSAEDILEFLKTENQANWTRCLHRQRIARVIRRLTGVGFARRVTWYHAGIDDSSGPQKWEGTIRKHAFRLDFYHWGDEPPTVNASGFRLVIVLDRSFG